MNGNYSASDPQKDLRPFILSENSPTMIFNLARDFIDKRKCNSANDVINLIYNEHNLKYIKVSVGSEIAMMLRPNRFWVGNVRTNWAHLLIKHGDDYELANEELELYRDEDRTSEMDYQIWAAIYPQLEVSLTRLANLGIDEAKKQKTKLPKEKNRRSYLWADAIANALYEHRKNPLYDN